MTDYSAMSDPARNPQFQRRWSEPPQEGPRLLGEIVAEVVEEIDRQAVAYWLSQAANLEGEEARKAFKTADEIRGSMGLSWNAIMGLKEVA